MPSRSLPSTVTFELHGKSNAVIDLAVHEENQQVVVFQQGNEQDAADRNRATTLIVYFAFNKEARDLEVLGRIYELGPVGPRTIPYYKYPEHFTFVKVTLIQNFAKLLISVLWKMEEKGCP